MTSNDHTVVRITESASALLSSAAPLPQWRVCERCGHMWRSRSRGMRFRCHRCEEAARTAACNASRVARGNGQ